MRAARAESVWVGVCAGASAVAVLCITRNGIGESPDSIEYLAGARSLLDHGTLSGADGEPLTVFPPGTSVLLAGVASLGFTLESAGPLIAVVGAISTVVLSHLLAAGRLGARSTAQLTATVAVAPALLVIWRMLWSETVFIALVLGALVLLDRARLGHRYVAASGLVLGVAFAWRYAAIGWVIGSALAIWLRHGWRKAASLCAAASVVVLIVVGRNLAVDGTLMGPRTGSSETLWSIARGTLRAVSFWMVPTASRPVALGVVAIGIVGLVLASQSASERDMRPSHALILGVVYVHLVASSLTTRLDDLNVRLLGPTFVPALIGLFGIAQQSRWSWPRRLAASYSTATVLVGVAYAWLRSPV